MARRAEKVHRIFKMETSPQRSSGRRLTVKAPGLCRVKGERAEVQQRAKKTHRLNPALSRALELLYFAILLALIATLFTMLYTDKATEALDMDELLNGRMPTQREGLEPFFDEIVFPQEMNAKDVILGINTRPVQRGGLVNWQIKNPYGNQFVVALEVVLENGERVFSSGSIPPGSSLESAPAEAELSPGSYGATAYVFAYSNLSYAYAGIFTLALELTVE